MQLQQAQAFRALASDMNAAVQQNMASFNQEFHAQQHQMQVHMQNAIPNPNLNQGNWMGGGNNMNMGGGGSGGGNPFTNQQPPGADSAYQRLPVNGRRRANKRERPSDFLEIGGGESVTKMPRFWE